MLTGSGLGYRRALATDLLSQPHDTPIHFIEAAPENWLKMGGMLRHQFDQAAERYPLALHGLSLSLGGFAPLDFELLKQIKQMMQQYHTSFFSEHISFSQDNAHLYDLLPVPFTEDMVRHIAERICQVQDFLGEKIAVENTSYYFHSPLAEMNEVQFLNAITQEADCYIHLDVNNIYVNAINHQLLPAKQFIDNVDKNRVKYIHIAGHNADNPQILIDTHGETVHENVWDLLDYAYAQLPQIPPTLLERDFHFPTFDELLNEVQHIENLQKKYKKEI